MSGRSGPVIRMYATVAALSFMVLAVAPGARASCVDVTRADHPTTVAMPDEFWRGHTAWANLSDIEQDFLARTAIATRNRRAAQIGRIFQRGVPDGIVPVPGYPDVKFTQPGAEPLTAMLGAANAHLATTGAKAVLGTGYRSYDEQLTQWPIHVKRYFMRHRDDLASHLKDGRYTDAGVCAFRDLAGKLYGFPGYSNHQSGRAIDFRLQMPGAPLLTASTDPAAKRVWCGSEFYRWMTGNARNFGFVQEDIDEPWHWAFDPEAARDPARASFVAPSCRP